VVPVLRKEFDALRPAHVPDGPTHAGLMAQKAAVELAAADVSTADMPVAEVSTAQLSTAGDPR